MREHIADVSDQVSVAGRDRRGEHLAVSRGQRRFRLLQRRVEHSGLGLRVLASGRDAESAQRLGGG